LLAGVLLSIFGGLIELPPRSTQNLTFAGPLTACRQSSRRPALFPRAVGRDGTPVRLGPALVLSRNTAARREAETRSTGGRHHRLFRNSLVVAQVAVSLVLLTGAGLMIRSYANLRSAQTGFRPDHLLTVRVTADFTRYPDTPARIKLNYRLLPEVRALSSVVTAAVGTSFPFNREASPTNMTRRFESGDGPVARCNDVMFVGAGIRNRWSMGRTFTDFDKLIVSVAVVNDNGPSAVASKIAIGKRFRRSQAPDKWSVSSDVEYGLHLHAQVYEAVAQTGFRKT
jgi:hypothetical protein